MTRPGKIPTKRDLHSGSSALVVDAITTRPKRRPCYDKAKDDRAGGGKGGIRKKAVMTVMVVVVVVVAVTMMIIKTAAATT